MCRTTLSKDKLGISGTSVVAGKCKTQTVHTEFSFSLSNSTCFERYGPLKLRIKFSDIPLRLEKT